METRRCRGEKRTRVLGFEPRAFGFGGQRRPVSRGEHNPARNSQNTNKFDIIQTKYLSVASCAVGPSRALSVTFRSQSGRGRQKKCDEASPATARPGACSVRGRGQREHRPLHSAVRGHRARRMGRTTETRRRSPRPWRAMAYHHDAPNAHARCADRPAESRTRPGLALAWPGRSHDWRRSPARCRASGETSDRTSAGCAPPRASGRRLRTVRARHARHW
jgi:hypothetical protein